MQPPQLYVVRSLQEKYGKRWKNLQFRVSTFSEKIALGVKMGEPGTVRILLTEGLDQRLEGET